MVEVSTKDGFAVSPVFRSSSSVRDWGDGASSCVGDASTRAATVTRISHLFSESGGLIGFFFSNTAYVAGLSPHEFNE